MDEYKINFMFDEEAGVWLAINDEIPLALESESLDELIKRVEVAAPELIELNNLPKYESLFLNIERREKMVYA